MVGDCGARRVVVLRGLAGLVALTISMSANAGWFSGTVPADLGPQDGRLQSCPDRPNFVCSQASGARYVEPFVYRGAAQTALVRLKQILLAMPRMRIVEERTDYLRAESSSRLFGFVDDVEFLIDAERHVLHVRSASRMGYSDLGVNRRRVEQIRQQFAIHSGT